jgi:hypothetical protein
MATPLRRPARQSGWHQTAAGNAGASDDPVEPVKLERFLHQHGDLLPRFRREVVARTDEIFNLETPWQQRRALDRLESEFQEAAREVEAYMSESKLGRILRSPWVALI